MSAVRVRDPPDHRSPARFPLSSTILSMWDSSSLIGLRLDVGQFVLADGAANDLIKQSRRKKIAV